MKNELETAQIRIEEEAILIEDEEQPREVYLQIELPS